MKDLFDDPKSAEDRIASLEGTAAKAVWGEIESHGKLLGGKKQRGAANAIEPSNIMDYSNGWTTAACLSAGVMFTRPPER